MHFVVVVGLVVDTFQGRYSEGQAARIMAEVAEAVGYLHNHGIIHFDLKPENIMLGKKLGEENHECYLVWDTVQDKGVSTVIAESRYAPCFEGGE